GDLAAEIGARYKVDQKRIYIAGHSNGAFMAYRMACDRAALVAGIMSLAGETWLDKSKCAPGAPVAVLQVQGTADDVIAYDGGSHIPKFSLAFAQAMLDWLLAHPKP